MSAVTLQSRPIGLSRCPTLRGASSTRLVLQAIKARWCLDIRYGSKMDAVELLQDWVQGVGAVAGLNAGNAAINSGSVGVPESRLELEVTFGTLADLETFWAAIPPAQHKDWSQRLQALVVHGSPTWEVYRTVDAFSSNKVAAASNASGVALVMPTSHEVGQYSSLAQPALPSTAQTTSSGISVVGSTDEADAILDWKGDPMKVNPGDKLPFTFR